MKTYPINKGVNRAVEFKGLKGKYIWWLGGGLVGLLGLFVALYVMGVNRLACVVLIIFMGLILFVQVYRVNRVYGEYGLMKLGAFRRTPRRVKSASRRIFFVVKENKGYGKESERAVAGIRHGG